MIINTAQLKAIFLNFFSQCKSVLINKQLPEEKIPEIKWNDEKK
jgi:hypothetical protein